MKGRRKGLGPKLADCLKIGQRFLVSFDNPKLAPARYKGKLQDLSRDGYLCIAAPANLRPPRGTKVTVSALVKGQDYSFSSQIQGRRKIKGRTPVFLLKPPSRIEHSHKRTAYRISVALRANVEWREGQNAGPFHTRAAVVTNLSGGGAEVFLRHRPDADRLRLSLTMPAGFIEETARRRRTGRDSDTRVSVSGESVARSEKLRHQFAGINARIAGIREHLKDAKGTIYAVSLAFYEPQEHCYHLVRYLERQSIKKGIDTERTTDVSGIRQSTDGQPAISKAKPPVPEAPPVGTGAPNRDAAVPVAA